MSKDKEGTNKTCITFSFPECREIGKVEVTEDVNVNVSENEFTIILNDNKKE